MVLKWLKNNTDSTNAKLNKTDHFFWTLTGKILAKAKLFDEKQWKCPIDNSTRWMLNAKKTDS